MAHTPQKTDVNCKSNCCKKCGVVGIRENRKISCVHCKNSFHSYCVDSPIKKDSWKCIDCDNIIKKNTDNDIIEISKTDFNTICEDFKSLQHKQNEILTTITAVQGLKTQCDEFSESVNQLSAKFDAILNLQTRVDQLESKTDCLEKQNTDLKNKYDQIYRRLNSVELNAYKSNIEIVGVPFSKSENLFEIFNKIRDTI